MDADFGDEDIFIMFVLYLEGKMDRLLGISPFELNNNSKHLTLPEIGEGEPPSKALLFKDGSVTVISGRSSYLANNGFKPYDESHFNTQYAIAVTKALASLHALLRVQGKKLLQTNTVDEHRIDHSDHGCNEEYKLNNNVGDEELLPQQSSVDSPKMYGVPDQDILTSYVSRSSLVSANLSIMCHQFEHKNVSSRVIRKLESLQQDIPTFTQFLHFASAMQTESLLQSVGPICMCDVWVPTTFTEEEEGNILVIRLRGGPHLQAPPLRDITWIWLTLLRPHILQDRYIELCESYCSSFNESVKRLHGNKNVAELTLFDVMKDLGDSFLHGFITIVHKFTVSGTWSLDRELHTSEGIHSIAESIGFLVDNGIIGSFFVV